MNSETVVQPRSNGSKPIRVLMADPDESLQPVYREPLLQEGFELATAASGLECVARLRERVPDVLVLEPQLPWGGGEGVLAMMGEVPRACDRSRDGPYLVPRSSSLGSRSAVSGKRLSAQTAGARSAGGKAPHHTRSSQTAFHLGRTKRPPGMFDRQANRRPRPRTCASRPLTGESLCMAAPTRTTSSNWRWPPCWKRLKPRESQSERVELDIEVAPVDGWQARRCALSETRNENYSNELALTNEFDLTKEN